jgi:hypothetical protein
MPTVGHCHVRSTLKLFTVSIVFCDIIYLLIHQYCFLLQDIHHNVHSFTMLADIAFILSYLPRLEAGSCYVPIDSYKLKALQMACCSLKLRLR